MEFIPTTLKIRPEHKMKLKILAAQHGMKMQDLLDIIFKRYLPEIEKEMSNNK